MAVHQSDSHVTCPKYASDRGKWVGEGCGRPYAEERMMVSRKDDVDESRLDFGAVRNVFGLPRYGCNPSVNSWTFAQFKFAHGCSLLLLFQHDRPVVLLLNIHLKNMR